MNCFHFLTRCPGIAFYTPITFTLFLRLLHDQGSHPHIVLSFSLSLSLSLPLSPFEFMVMIWTVSIVSTLSAYRAFSSHYINSFCSILWILMDVKTNYNKKEMQTESWITFKMVHRNITSGSCCLLKYGLVLSVIST